MLPGVIAATQFIHRGPPNALSRIPVTSRARLHGDAFLPVSLSRALVFYTRACVSVYTPLLMPRRTLHVIFFGRRHVRANIAAYAYLYGIKNHPSLKMHRPLHSRGARIFAARDAEATKRRFAHAFCIFFFFFIIRVCAEVPFYARKGEIGLST